MNKTTKNKGGTIQQLSNGKYKWTGCYTDPMTKKKKRPNRTFNTLQEAKEYRKKYLESIIAENERIKAGLTVNEMYERWALKYFTENGKYYSVNTQDDYRSIFNSRLLPLIGNDKIDNINFNRLQTYILSLDKLSKQRQKNIIKCLKSFVNDSVNEGFIPQGLYDEKFDKFRYNGYVNQKSQIYNYLTESKYQRVIKNLKDKQSHYANIIEFLHETGLRIEELAITPNDLILKYKHEYIKLDDLSPEILPYVTAQAKINKALKRVYNPKTEQTEITEINKLKSSSSVRTIPINSTALQNIYNLVNFYNDKNIKTKYLFSSSTGTLLEERNVLRAFHTAINQCNENKNLPHIDKCGLHALRKLYCKNSHDIDGLDFKIISKLMGHSDASVTLKYYYAIDDDDIEEITTIKNKNTQIYADEMKRLDYMDGDVGDLIEDEDGNYIIVEDL